MSEEPENSNILCSISPEDVEWRSEAWELSDGRKFPAKDHFDEGMALAALLANEVIFLNTHHWEKSWPEDAQKTTALCVNCSDVFAWACADAEGITLDEIPDLYRMWRKDAEWGAAVWCMLKRGQMPQKPLEGIIRKAAIWDLDGLPLKANWQDAEVAAFFASLRAQP